MIIKNKNIYKSKIYNAYDLKIAYVHTAVFGTNAIFLFVYVILFLYTIKLNGTRNINTNLKYVRLWKEWLFNMYIQVVSINKQMSNNEKISFLN